MPAESMIASTPQVSSAVALPGDDREAAAFAALAERSERRRGAADIDIQEGSGAEGGLGVSRVDAPLAYERSLLVPDEGADGWGASQGAGLGEVA